MFICFLREIRSSLCRLFDSDSDRWRPGRLPFQLTAVSMEEDTEERFNISSSDLHNLQLTIARFIAQIDSSSDDCLFRLKPVLRGLSAHEPSKRCGYAIILSTLLDRFFSRFTEDSVMQYLLRFKFAKAKTSRKSSARTGIIGKILAFVAFVRAGLLKRDDYVGTILEQFSEVASAQPALNAFVFLSMANVVIATDFRFLSVAAKLIPSILDGFIFWFKISMLIPPELKGALPVQFQKGLPFNEMTAESLQRTYLQTKQPWNSQVWKLILTSTTGDELLTFWSQIFEKQMRTGDVRAKITIIHIVRCILPVLKPCQFPVVLSAGFVKMINSLLPQQMAHEPVLDFLSYVVTIAEPQIRLYADAFKYVDYGQPRGFEFHREIFDKCSIDDLRSFFEEICSFGHTQMIDYRLRFTSDKNQDRFVTLFKLSTLRALLISSARFNDPSLSIGIFQFLQERFPEQLSPLVSDLVAFDTARVDGSATLAMLLGDATLSHFESCYRLYSLCAGVSASSSMDALVPPDVTDSAAAINFMPLALEKAGEPALISHAFKSELRLIAPTVAADVLGRFFAEYVPVADTFSTATVDMFRVIVTNSVFSRDFIGPLFQLFCRTLTNVGLSLAQSVADLITDSFALESGHFDFVRVIKSLFSTMSGLSYKVLTSHERLVSQTFSACLAAVVSASVPLPPRLAKALEQQLDAAMADFAFKTNPHFSEDIFTSMLDLPEGVPQLLFPVVLKHLPGVHRVHRRVMLLAIVSRLLEMPRGLEVLATRGADFNRAVGALLGEDFAQNKDNEKRFVKGLLAINRWFALIEKKRSACASINVGDFKRRLSGIASQGRDAVVAQARQALGHLQKIEGQVHPKQRVFT
jgi:hypothetical protein